MNLPTPTSRLPTVFAALLLLGTGLAGCLSQDASASSGEIYVKDALTDEAAEVHVTFTKAEVLAADGGPWVTVFEGEESIELLSLSNSTAKAKLAEFDIDAGEYKHLRITVADVTVVDHNGTEQEITVFGNLVTIAHDLEFDADDDNRVLVDFDLESGLDLAAGEYAPVVGDVQDAKSDADGDGEVDIDDADDDGDGTEDAEDADRDGDGAPDLPAQTQAFDQNGLFGLCTTWESSETGRTHGNATDSAAFQWLANQSAEAGLSVEAYCAENAERGPPGDIVALDREDLPEPARKALEDAPRGPPADAGADQRGDDERGNASDRPDDAQRDGNASAQSNQTDENRTAQDGNRAAEDDDRSADGNESHQDGNQSGEEPRG